MEKENPNSFVYSPKISFECVEGIKMEIPKENEKTDFSTKTSTPLVLVEQHIDISIVSKIAKVEQYLHFFNGTKETLMGELLFTLPPESTFKGFGLDIDGVINEANVVSKDLARVAFEEVHPEKGEICIAEKIDEFSNMFKTRVYPMNPNQKRIVKIVYLTNLVEDESNRLFFLYVTPKKLNRFSVKFSGKDGDCFYKSVGKDELIKEDFGKLDEKSKFEGVMVKLKKLQNAVYIEKDPNCAEVFFTATIKVPEMGKEEKKEEKKVKRITVFYDCSSSRNSSNTKMEVENVLKIFAKYKSAEFEIITFSLKIHERKTFQNSTELGKFLEKITYDGGTCIPFKEINESSKNSDFIFLFSDGLNTYGYNVEEELQGMEYDTPIYTFSSSEKASFLLLNFLSEKSSGKYFNLLKEKNVIEESVGKTHIGVKSVESNDEEVKEIYSSSIVNGYLSIFGRVIGQTAKINVDCGHVKIPVIVSLKENEMLQTKLVQTLWAQAKINKLSIFANKNKNEIEDIGKKYGILTAHTSLIVLQGIDQYLRYKIVPPKSKKKMRKEYLNTVMKEDVEEENRVKKKLETVSKKWKARIQWHKRKFELKKKEEPVKPKVKLITGTERIVRSSLRDRMMRMTDNEPVNNTNNNDRSDLRDRLLRRRDDEPNRTERTLRNARHQIENMYRNNVDNNVDNTRRRSRERNPNPERRQRRRSLCDRMTVSSSSSNRSNEVEQPTNSNSDSNTGDGSIINIKAWNPKMSYLKNIKESKTPYETYLKEKESHNELPSFFLDVADYFLVTLKEKEQGLRILSNIVELELNNPQLLRIIGYRLDQEELHDQASEVFRRVLALKPEEPQSHRDLALVLEKKEKYLEAAELLYKVIIGKWAPRFNEIELTALVELNHVLERMKKDVKKQFVKKLIKNEEFIYKFDVDIRISMGWDTDMTDIDLHVYDPLGEHCFYSKKETTTGGFISRDFTNGYGPEEFMQREVLKEGIYRITAKYFASHQQSLTGGTTILTAIYTNYNRENEERRLITVRLASNKEEVEVCKLNFEKK